MPHLDAVAAATNNDAFAGAWEGVFGSDICRPCTSDSLPFAPLQEEYEGVPEWANDEPAEQALTLDPTATPFFFAPTPVDTLPTREAVVEEVRSSLFSS